MSRCASVGAAILVVALSGCTADAGRPNASASGSAAAILSYESDYADSDGATVVAQTSGTGTTDLALPGLDAAAKVVVYFDCLGAGDVSIVGTGASSARAGGMCDAVYSEKPGLYVVEFAATTPVTAEGLRISTTGSAIYYVTVATKTG